MARTVPLKLSYASSKSGLFQGPQYTIREDPPWLLTRSQSEGAVAQSRASSTYSVQLDDEEIAAAGGERHIHYNSIMDNNVTQPLNARQASFPSEHSASSPRQDIVPETPTPQPPQSQPTRTTRLPIFKQVRSMLSNKTAAAAAAAVSPSSTSPTSNAIKWDEYSGEISEYGKEARVKPSTYKNPYEGILKPRRQSASRVQPQQARAISPVSVLVDSELQMLEQEPGNMSPPNSRPVSPVSAIDPPMVSEPVAVTRPKTSGETGRVKRKPVASQTEAFPEADMRMLPSSSHGAPTQSEDPSSRFSWTTAAQSEAARRSTDTRFSRKPEHDSQYNSHFSWSTVASTAPVMALQREQTPPPSPPPVPPQYLEPPTYGPPSVQSILSRTRPYKRIEKPEWAPPPAPAPAISEGYTPRSLTPKVQRIEEHPISTTPTVDGKKRLPLPPLFTEKSLSHLEALLTQEKNVLMQRRNIEKSIADLERIELASPLEVSFSVVREAKKKLEERRKVLDEIRLEEMDVGIRIARARRKEDFGDGEGTFWVRRVTG